MSAVPFRVGLEYPKHTTPSSKDSSFLRVMVTHPHHPLYGQQVVVIRIRRGPDPDLIIRFPDGFYGAISASWTDYAVGSDMTLSPDPPPLLDLLGLCQMAQRIAQLRSRPGRDDAWTRSPDGSGYAHQGRLCPSLP